MALITKAIKGTKDVLPQDAYKIQYIEATARETAADFGYKEIRTPVFEHTELFQRGVGDTTDVVQKEMYTFDDKGGRSITLRPEGTSGAARAFLENGLCNEALPQKVYYLDSCYRYEKPQAGRLREFHQFGVECFGTQSPLSDAEQSPWLPRSLTGWGSPNCDWRSTPSAAPLAVPNIMTPCAATLLPAKTNCATPVRAGWSATPCAFWTAKARYVRRSPRTPRQ